MIKRVIIVEDETAAAVNLRSMLSIVAPEAEVVEVLESVEEAVEFFKAEVDADVVFMFFFAWGTALMVIGIVRLRQYRKLMASPEAMRAQEVAETDERNVMLANKAKSYAFFWYVLICSVAVIVLEFMNQVQIATSLAFSVCFLILLYWVCYYVLRRKY